MSEEERLFSGIEYSAPHRAKLAGLLKNKKLPPSDKQRVQEALVRQFAGDLLQTDLQRRESFLAGLKDLLRGHYHQPTAVRRMTPSLNVAGRLQPVHHPG